MNGGNHAQRREIIRPNIVAFDRNGLDQHTALDRSNRQTTPQGRDPRIGGGQNAWNRTYMFPQTLEERHVLLLAGGACHCVHGD